MKLTKKFFYLSLLCGIYSCSHNSDNIKLKELKSVKILDDLKPLTKLPDKLLPINDSVIGLADYPNLFSLYNTNTGKNLFNFDKLNFDVDSLINKTFQIQSKGKLSYIKHTAEELENKQGSLFQINSFASYKNKYFLKITIKTSASFDNLVSFLAKYQTNKVQVDSLASLYKAANIISRELLDYIVVINENYKVESVLPLYDISISNDHSVFFDKSFYVKNNTLYVPIIFGNLGVPYDSVTMEHIPLKYCFASATYDSSEISSFTPEIESNKIVYTKDYSINAHLALSCLYYEYDDNLYASCGKEIINIDKKKREDIDFPIKDKEYILAFNINNHYLCYITEQSSKKKIIDNTMRFYGNTDTLMSNNFKIYDLKSKQLSFEQKLNTSSLYRFVNEKRFIEFFRKGEYYYCTQYEITKD